MPLDASPLALSNDPFRSNHRTPLKKVVQDGISSSSSSSSDSSSGSSNSSQSESSSSSDGSSSVEVLRVEKPLNHSNAVISEPELAQSLKRGGKSSFERKGSKPMEATSHLLQPSVTSPNAIALERVDECVAFDDEFPWFDDEAADYDKPSGLPGTVVIQAATGASINDNFAGTGNFEESLIGPFYQSDRKTEVDPALYSPPRYYHKQPPIVHQLSLHNRPKHVRKYIPVTQLFKSPISALWKSKFDKFNTLQSEVSTVLVSKNDNVVVSAPTSSGKTAVFEMAMARHISMDLEVLRESSDWRQKQLPKCRKIVYISPSKALCEERYEDWSHRLSDLKLGITSAMITGDAEPGEAFRSIASSHLILTTPEKWDSLTRRWTENFVLFGSVKLILVDEVHLLGDACRGCCLESVLCRMKTIVRAAQACEMNENQIKTSRYESNGCELFSLTNALLTCFFDSAT
jgi:DEAD/DEAH box helicase